MTLFCDRRQSKRSHSYRWNFPEGRGGEQDSPDHEFNKRHSTPYEHKDNEHSRTEHCGTDSTSDFEAFLPDLGIHGAQIILSRR